MLQLLCHLTSDFLLQNSWMAGGKHQRWFPAIVHGFIYCLPFLLLTRNWLDLLIIGGSHAILDHYRIASIVPRIYNWNWSDWQWHGWLNPKSYDPNDQPSGLPAHLNWLNIVIDQVIHLWVNYLVLTGL